MQSTFNASEKKKYTTDGNLIELILFRDIEVLEVDKNPEMLDGQDGNWGIRKNNVDTPIGPKITEEHGRLSEMGIINYEMLIFRIDSGYKPSCKHF